MVPSVIHYVEKQYFPLRHSPGFHGDPQGSLWDDRNRSRRVLWKNDPVIVPWGDRYLPTYDMSC